MSDQPPLGFLLGLEAKPVPLHADDHITFGREPTCTFHLNDALVSRKHSAIVVSPTGLVTVQDLGSTNHTFVNEKRIEPGFPVKLKTNDNIRIGGQMITFIANDVDFHPASAGLQKKVRLATMKTVVIEKPTAHTDERQQSSTRKYAPVPPRGVESESDKTALSPAVAPNAEGFALEGNLEEQMFAQLVQFLHNARRTGEVFIKHEAAEAVVGISNGNVIFAQMGDRLGIDVVFEVARWQQGTFQFKSKEKLERPRNVVHPTVNIILRCCQILDEESR